MVKKAEAAEKAAVATYTVAKGISVGFRAGIKVHGDIVDLSWPEFEADKKLLDEMLEKGLLVKK